MIRGKAEKNRHDRRNTKRRLREMTMNGTGGNSLGDARLHNKKSKILEKLGLPSDILNSVFSRLDNQDLRQLVFALDKI